MQCTLMIDVQHGHCTPHLNVSPKCKWTYIWDQQGLITSVY